MMLMRQRKMVGQEPSSLARKDSFDTNVGMAFSTKGGLEDFKKDESASSNESEGEHDSQEKHHVHFLETEKYLKTQETEFLRTI
jgi:hypothetical protein